MIGKHNDWKTTSIILKDKIIVSGFSYSYVLSEKKFIKTHFDTLIHWNFNFIGKMVLRLVITLTNWLVHTTWITPLSESEFPTIATYFFFTLFFPLRNNPFGFIAWPFVSLRHCACL